MRFWHICTFRVFIELNIICLFIYYVIWDIKHSAIFYKYDARGLCLQAKLWNFWLQKTQFWFDQKHIFYLNPILNIMIIWLSISSPVISLKHSITLKILRSCFHRILITYDVWFYDEKNYLFKCWSTGVFFLNVTFVISSLQFNVRDFILLRWRQPYENIVLLCG